MRQAEILYKGQSAGRLIQDDQGAFTFLYHDHWLADTFKPAISLTLPKTVKTYHSGHLFPVFFNMLPEGYNKQVVCKLLRIDEADYFGLLLNTARYDTIGAVTVQKITD